MPLLDDHRVCSDWCPSARPVCLLSSDHAFLSPASAFAPIVVSVGVGRMLFALGGVTCCDL